MEFQQFSDEELIQQYRNGTESAIDVIFERYKNLVRKKARMLYLAGGDNDDLIQEGMIGLYKAVRDFDSSKQASFATFAELCINRHLMSAVTASNRKKNAPLNSYVSFDTPANSEAGDDTTLVELLQSNAQNPEALIIDQEHTAILQERIAGVLSAYENKVLDMYLEGKNYIQIAQELDKEPKSVDNALQRIRSKVEKVRIL